MRLSKDAADNRGKNQTESAPPLDSLQKSVVGPSTRRGECSPSDRSAASKRLGSAEFFRSTDRCAVVFSDARGIGVWSDSGKRVVGPVNAP